MGSTTTETSSLTVSAVSTVSVDILHQDVQKVLQLAYLDITHIQLTKNSSVNGVNYREGMVVVHGSIGGLPEFAEVVQTVVVEKSLSFIVKKFDAWYREHLRAQFVPLQKSPSFNFVPCWTSTPWQITGLEAGEW